MERIDIIRNKLYQRIEDAYRDLAAAHDQENELDIAYWTTAWQDEDAPGEYARKYLWPVQEKIYELEQMVIRLSFRLSLVADYQPLPSNYFYR